MGWNKYSYINIEFDNQIICRKSKHSATSHTAVAPPQQPVQPTVPAQAEPASTAEKPNATAEKAKTTAEKTKAAAPAAANKTEKKPQTAKKTTPKPKQQN